jgi:hypothetical protein
MNQFSAASFSTATSNCSDSTATSNCSDSTATSYCSPYQPVFFTPKFGFTSTAPYIDKICEFQGCGAILGYFGEDNYCQIHIPFKISNEYNGRYYYVIKDGKYVAKLPNYNPENRKQVMTILQTLPTCAIEGCHNLVGGEIVGIDGPICNLHMNPFCSFENCTSRVYAQGDICELHNEGNE